MDKELVDVFDCEVRARKRVNDEGWHLSSEDGRQFVPSQLQTFHDPGTVAHGSDGSGRFGEFAIREQITGQDAVACRNRGEDEGSGPSPNSGATFLSAGSTNSAERAAVATNAVSAKPLRR